MSQGVLERIVFLRRSIAAIEARGSGRVDARLDDLSRELGRDGRDLGEASRDPFERLLDDLCSGGSSEIIPARPADAAAAASFAFALVLRCAVARPRAGVVWIAEDMVAREIGLPYGRGFEAAGLAPGRLILVRTRRPRETLWAMEEALRSKAAAVVAETWLSPGAYDLTASRRLALAAGRGGGAGLLLLPRAAGEAAKLGSAAQTRFEIASSFVQRADAAAFLAARAPLPGPLAWRVRIAKARALLRGGDFDPQCWRDIVFEHEKALFRHALPLRFPAASADRPDSSPAAQGKRRESG